MKTLEELKQRQVYACAILINIGLGHTSKEELATIVHALLEDNDQMIDQLSALLKEDN